MRALSIRQPYAELILRGIKKIEYRSRPTLAEVCSERERIPVLPEHPWAVHRFVRPGLARIRPGSCSSLQASLHPTSRR